MTSELPAPVVPSPISSNGAPAPFVWSGQRILRASNSGSISATVGAARAPEPESAKPSNGSEQPEKKRRGKPWVCFPYARGACTYGKACKYPHDPRRANQYLCQEAKKLKTAVISNGSGSSPAQLPAVRGAVGDARSAGGGPATSAEAQLPPAARSARLERRAGASPEDIPPASAAGAAAPTPLASSAGAGGQRAVERQRSRRGFQSRGGRGTGGLQTSGVARGRGNSGPSSSANARRDVISSAPNPQPLSDGGGGGEEPRQSSAQGAGGQEKEVEARDENSRALPTQ